MKWILLSLGPFLFNCAICQDEFFVKRMIEGRFQSKKGRNIAPLDDWFFQVRSAAYHYDFNGDGLRESINTLKSDGSDYLEMRDNNGRLILRREIPAQGGNSHLYKVGIYKISKRHLTLVLHFFEGVIDQVNFLATARLYFLTIENLDFENSVLYQGPTFYEERETRNANYIRRVLKTEVKDLNRDGYRDIMVSLGRINRVYMYIGKGSWKKI